MFELLFFIIVLGHRYVVTAAVLTGYLAIGVPSIKRINGDMYVIQTVQSLVDESSPLEQLDMIVIVFLADFDDEYNDQVAQKLNTKFKDYIHMGFLQIVRVSRDFYPNFSGLKRTFSDSASRVQWRAKQVTDYAFLFMYARHLSHYYLQLEDDVRCAPNYFKDIKQFIHIQRANSWAVLEFSELGFIGKLFKNTDLPKLAQFMLTFYVEQPVDWLISYFRLVMTQHDIILRKPTLFQHIGKKSSFDISKDNLLLDRFFAGSDKKWRSDDPPAMVMTTMQHHENNFVQLVYAAGSGFFWAKEPRMGDSISIVFEQPQRVTQVVIETGNNQHPVDILHHGTVELSHTLIKQDERAGRAVCGDPVVIGHVQQGRCNVENVTSVFTPTARCLIVTVSGNQDNWILFDQIGVFVEQTHD